MKTLFSLLIVLGSILGLRNTAWAQPRDVPQPRIATDWWPIAGDPDLGELTTTNQQPVDFGVWQAADGSWQLWSCIRGTKETGVTRLFYHWEDPRAETP